MIAHLFNAPLGESEAAVGVGTVGSSEAIMLAGLAFKRKWQNRRKAEGKPYDKPNIVTGANVQVRSLLPTTPSQTIIFFFLLILASNPVKRGSLDRKVCWEKFARYFEVELKEVKLRDGYYVMDPKKAVELVDENTICVAAILGSTLNGEFEDVKLLNDLLAEKNKKKGYVPCPLALLSMGLHALNDLVHVLHDADGTRRSMWTRRAAGSSRRSCTRSWSGISGCRW